MALVNFPCPYCGTTQLLRQRENMVTCGGSACGTKRQRELNRLSQSKKKKPKKDKGKAIIPKNKVETKDKKSFPIEPIGIVNGYGSENKSVYQTEFPMQEYIGKKSVFFFGKNYQIDWDETAKFKNGIVTKKETISNTKCFLVLKDFMVEKRDEKDYYNESA